MAEECGLDCRLPACFLQKYDDSNCSVQSTLQLRLPLGHVLCLSHCSSGTPHSRSVHTACSPICKAVLTSCVLQEGGVLYTWGGLSGGTLPSGAAAAAPVKGDSNKGCLGLGDTAGRDRPTRSVPPMVLSSSMCCGSRERAGAAAAAPVKGDSNKGCLGLGDTAGRDRPTRSVAPMVLSSSVCCGSPERAGAAAAAPVKGDSNKGCLGLGGHH